jgi:D-hydroxyproline dehydrogenase subunit alpha
MNSAAEIEFDVAVVGAGPAGIAAATVAAECGASVVSLDDNLGVGGQIWRGESRVSKNSSAANWYARLERANVKRLHSARVFHAGDGTLSAETATGVEHVTYRSLILATGARERFLPFPGWTLPNVMGAGALQALIKSGLPVAGKRIVIAGTGPLLLAVAACAKEKGAKIVCIAEQTSWKKFAGFGLSVFSSAQRLWDAVRLGSELWRTPHWKNCWPVAARGTDRVVSIVLTHNGNKKEVACDYLACGFHLVPNLELAQYAGCKIKDGFVDVTQNQETSVPGVYTAGETTGIGGYELALLEGRIAGYSAVQRKDLAQTLATERKKTLEYVRAMNAAFALREELRSVPQHDTLICRCEDVTLGRVREHDSWRSAKLHTRIGMGPCQGRVCGSACEFLFNWEIDATRPPIFPVQCSSLAEIRSGASPASSRGGVR